LAKDKTIDQKLGEIKRFSDDILLQSIMVVNHNTVSSMPVAKNL